MSSTLSPERQLDAFLDKFTPDIAAQARTALRKMRGRLPGAYELVYDNYNALAIGFSPTERASDGIFSIALFPRWVSLFFLQNGTRLRDPAGILEGSGNQARHIKLKDPALLDSPAVQDLIAQALELATKQIDPTQPRRLIIKSISASTAPSPPRFQKIAAGQSHFDFLSLFRITSFSPDHTASTAHTLISTSPSGNATSRTPSSVMSVSIFDALRDGLLRPRHPNRSILRQHSAQPHQMLAQLLLSRLQIRAPSRDPRAGVFTSFGFSPSRAISSATLAGIFHRHVRCLSFTPSFLPSGVPEYPAVGVIIDLSAELPEY